MDPAANDDELFSDTGDMLGMLDIALPSRPERTVKDWKAGPKTKGKTGKKAKKPGVNVNRPEMALPTDLFAQAADPKPEYYEEGGLRRVVPYQFVLVPRPTYFALS